MALRRHGRWTWWWINGAIVAALTVAVVLAVVEVRQWLRGEPYPVADPRVTGQRLRDASQTAYGALDVDGPAELRVEPNPCSERGGLEITPDVEPDVFGMYAVWSVEMRPDEIPAAMGQARDALLAAGWRIAEESDRAKAPYVRLEGGVSATLYLDVLENDAGEYESAHLAMSSRAGCARLPENYTGPRPESSFGPWDLGLAPLAP